MTRQVALGAIIAFCLTALVLSIWQPTPAETPAPVPAPAPTGPVTPPTTNPIAAPRGDLQLRPAVGARAELLQRQVLPLMRAAMDAGTP